jgi:hypothetical protein
MLSMKRYCLFPWKRSRCKMHAAVTQHITRRRQQHTGLPPKKGAEPAVKVGR